MAPADKTRAAGVSVSSFFDLKAELAKKSDEFVRTKAAGSSKYVSGKGRTRPDKVRIHHSASLSFVAEERSKTLLMISCIPSSRNRPYGPDRTRAYMAARRATSSSKQ